MPVKAGCIDRTAKLKKNKRMKKLTHFHLNDNAKIALMAIGFLTFIMALSYLYWFV